MRQVFRVSMVVVVAVISGALEAPGRDDGGWVGQRVVTKTGAVLRVGRQVVSDPDPDHARRERTGRRPVRRIYQVERVQGLWLWLVPEGQGPSGWVRATSVVPRDQAIADLDRQIQAHPADAGLYLDRALLWSDQQDHDRALADVDRTIRLDPLDALAYSLRSKVWNGKGERDKALADLTETIRLDPKSADAHCARARIWGSKHECQKMLLDCNEAIRLGHHRCAEIYVTRGAAWLKMGERDKAFADFDQALCIDPKNALALKVRSVLLAAKHDLDAAIAGFTAAMRLDPEDAHVYEGRGLARAGTGDYDGAIADYTEAIRLKPDLDTTPALFLMHLSRGTSRARGGDLAGAVADLEEAMRRRQDPFAFYVRALTRMARGDMEGAIADATEAIALESGFSYAYEARGRARQKQGDLDRAVADYTRAIALDAKNGAAYAARASAWRDRGEPGKSAADLDEAARHQANSDHLAKRAGTANDDPVREAAAHLTELEAGLRDGFESILVLVALGSFPEPKRDADVMTTSASHTRESPRAK